MTISVDNFTEPTKATLLVQVGDETPRPATEEDLLKFGYVSVATAFTKAEAPKEKESASDEQETPHYAVRDNSRGLGDIFSGLLGSSNFPLPPFSFPEAPYRTHSEPRNSPSQPGIPLEQLSLILDYANRIASSRRRNGENGSTSSD